MCAREQTFKCALKKKHHAGCMRAQMHVVVNAVKRFLSEMSAFVTIRNVLPRGQVGNRSQPFSPRMILRWTERSLHAVPIRAVGRIGLRRSATRAPGGRRYASGTGFLHRPPSWTLLAGIGRPCGKLRRVGGTAHKGIPVRDLL